MSLRVLIFSSFLFFFHTKNFSQDYFSYGGDNFSGLNQVIANPAAAADNRLKLDVILTGLDFNFNNTWFAIKREATKNSGSLTHPVFPTTWQNITPNVADNVFKNFTKISSGKNYSMILENRILLPSVMYQINAKNSIAFTWSVRQMANIDGISPQLGNLFEKELDLNVTQNNRIQNKNLSAVQMTWAEYGFTYARVLQDKKEHFFKAGITPKLLQGLESAYLVVKDLDFLFSTKDTSSYFNANFSYAHSGGFDPPKSDHPIKEVYRFVAKPTLGLDLGIIYEWRPNYKMYKYKPKGQKLTWRKDLNKYKIKFGASLVDVGKIKYQKEGSYYDLNVNVRRADFLSFTDVKNVGMFDSLVTKNYSSQNQTSEYSIMLPTAVNTQLDFALNRFFYLNLSAHITNFSSSNFYRVHNYSAVCFAPRVEHYWFDVSLPFTFNALSVQRYQYLMTGLNLRLGPLCIGTNNLGPIFKGDISSYNFYAILKVAIPYKLINDQDGDGVIDRKDECPDEYGDPTLKGCPDLDHDKIPDKIDLCPHQAGLVEFKGCPDTDGDGIKDGEDACPFDKGSVALKGCPDADGDSIIDKIDMCPTVPGLKQFKGCPDTDNDGIVDSEDLCPNAKGPLKYKGCPDTDGDLVHDGIDICKDEVGAVDYFGCPWPDTDKDGIIDKKDSCINIPGVVAFNGCPAPVILTPVEKRVLQKAFSSLEFESGKDIIKPASFASLNALAKLLLKHTSDWTLKLSGHTDNEGTEASNLILSEKRVAAVQKYLVKKGAPKENVKGEWFGQNKPIANNATKEGKRKNRRVEMTVSMRAE